jgi:hypothetical protein
VPTTPLREAFIETLPVVTGEARPLLFTVATLLLLDVHPAVVVTSLNVPSE